MIQKVHFSQNFVAIILQNLNQNNKSYLTELRILCFRKKTVKLVCSARELKDLLHSDAIQEENNWICNNYINATRY